MTEQMKTCTKCRADKPPEEFHRDRSRPDGRFPQCRECRKPYVREYAQRESTRARGRARYELAKLNPGRCELDGCNKPTYDARICSMHRARIDRHGDPDVVKLPTYRLGPDNHGWLSDDEAGYGVAHQRLKRARGRASEHQCEAPGCEKQAAHWAYGYGDPTEREEVVRGGARPSPYSLDPSHYFPLCVACHKRADLVVTRLRREREQIIRTAEAEISSRQFWFDLGYCRAA